MLSFVDFSSISEDTYLVIDEDAFYTWNVDGLKSKLVRQWLTDRQTYKFKLEFDGKITNIAVYKGGECLLCEELEDVIYL